MEYGRGERKPAAGVRGGGIGWVVCCGLLRLGRDSSAPATGGGFSRVPRGVPPRERTNPIRVPARERDRRKKRERGKRWEKGGCASAQRGLLSRSASRARNLPRPRLSSLPITSDRGAVFRARGKAVAEDGAAEVEEEEEEKEGKDGGDSGTDGGRGTRPERDGLKARRTGDQSATL